MKTNQLNRGELRRVMYIENKNGEIDGVTARIGWVEFSKSGKSIYYRGKTLTRSGGQGIKGNHFDIDTGEEYWVSGVKERGSNTHWAETTYVEIDPEAREEYERTRNSKDT